MSNIVPTRPTRRRVIGCDVGPLGPAAEAAARAQGVNLSAWVRQAIRKALPDEAAVSKPAQSPPSRVPREHRAWLTADDRRKLEAIAHQLGLRSHTAALRLLIARAHTDGHADPFTPVDAGRAESIAATGGGPPAGAAVDALCRSNAELTGLARSLLRLVQMLEAQPGHRLAADRWLIERAERDIRAHLQQAASIVARLEPLVPPPVAARPPRRAAR